MSTIDITKEDDGLIRVRVVRQIRRRGRSEVVELNGAHPHLKLFLKYTCERNNSVLDAGNVFEFNVWLTLTFVENSSEKLNKRIRPLAVWGNINSMNGGEKIPLKNSSPNEWNSEPFLVLVLRKKVGRLIEEFQGIDFDGSLNCLLWIKFDSVKMLTVTYHQKKLLEQIVELFVNQTNCDVVFYFDNDQRIGGHIAILSARSPVFAAMFQHNMKERQEGQVDIHDIKFNIFKQLLNYIYSGQLESPLSEEEAQPLYVAAEKYDFVELKEECIEFLISNTQVNNAVNLLAWAHLHSIDKLQEATLDFVALHGKEICSQADWTNLAKSYPDLCVTATQRMMANMSVVNQPRQ